MRGICRVRRWISDILVGFETRTELVLLYPPILNAQKGRTYCSPSRSCWTKFLRKAFITTIEWPACIPDFNTVIKVQVILVIELNAKEKFDMVSW